MDNDVAKQRIVAHHASHVLCSCITFFHHGQAEKSHAGTLLLTLSSPLHKKFFELSVVVRAFQEKFCQTVSVEVRKSQHKYVIGPRGCNLHEILQTSGVSVEVPPLDNPSATITLRGLPDELGPAVTMVYAKADGVVIAEVDAPCWLHRFIIGRQGSNVRKITQDLPKVGMT